MLEWSLFFFYVFGKLHTHLVSLEPMITLATMFVWGEEVPFEQELIGL